MNLTLPPEIQRIIDERVQSGRYRSAEEVVGAALAYLDQWESVENLTPEEFNAMFADAPQKIAAGLASAEAGTVSDGEAVFDQLELEDLRRKIDKGLAEVGRGEFDNFTAKDVIAERRSLRGAGTPLTP